MLIPLRVITALYTTIANIAPSFSPMMVAEGFMRGGVSLDGASPEKRVWIFGLGSRPPLDFLLNEIYV